MIANILGFMGMVSLFLIYQQKSRKNILLCKLTADVFWILHYLSLGATAGMIPNFVGVFREIVFVNRKTKKWADTPIWVGVFILVNFVLGVLSFDEWYDAIPIVASAFMTVGFWLDNPRLTKLISLPVCISFFTYDLFVLSYMGMINESISLISIIIYLVRSFKEKNNK